MKKIITLTLLCLVTYVNALEFSGTVISDNEKYITSRNMGYVKNVYVREGSYVKTGDSLYDIEAEDISQKKNQANLQVSMYETQMNFVKMNYERHQRLYEKGLVAKVQVEQLEMNYKNLQDMVAIAKSQSKEVDNQNKYFSIKAPNNGIVTKRMLKVGEMAIPGMPAMVLTDISDIKIQIEVNEADLSKVRLGKKVPIEIPSVGYSSTGVVKSIVPSLNPLTHTFIIKIGFKKPSSVYPGMYAKININ
ncbi:MAG: efflux RND transporter periplasmic adaptor subunit [Arcobacteraceae bacterium]|jgi:RND family efflux transporter MFP subunit|nr:efflux RND transporter periplasmic adaptor subunit [Arcobacteraceae bacterium]